MFLKLGARAAPSLFLVRALEGRETARKELSSLVQGIVNSTGFLKRAIRVSAYYGVSAEYKARQSHSSKEIEAAYLAWFEKRSKPTILVVHLSEIDGVTLQFNIYESSPIVHARMLLLPLLALAFSLYWFRKRHTWFATDRQMQTDR